MVQYLEAALMKIWTLVSTATAKSRYCLISNKHWFLISKMKVVTAFH
ncbi:hypothetical protein FM107_14135 [Sphingobacterium sp. JB170]|nr:hypothetical protein FM107_14135 [Sphingobacterium sp. JB170]